ncbi:MAG: hypothetical protein R2800_03385 [Flavipsychrobacter sp.]
MNFKYFHSGRLIVFILILALVFQPISNKLEAWVSKYEYLSSIATYIDVFSTLGLISLTFAFINYIGWKWKIFQWLINVPNLRGRYKGKLMSSYTDNAGNNTEKDCVIEITQTASSINIHSYYGDAHTGQVTSQSFSSLVEIVKDTNGHFLLYYVFSNEPEPLSPDLFDHSGTSRLKYLTDSKNLVGEYYNKRLNRGSINVVFKQKKLLGCLYS